MLENEDKVIAELKAVVSTIVDQVKLAIQSSERAVSAVDKMKETIASNHQQSLDELQIIKVQKEALDDMLTEMDSRIEGMEEATAALVAIAEDLQPIISQQRAIHQ